MNNIWDKILKNRPSEICGRQSLRNLRKKFFTASEKNDVHLKSLRD